MGGILVDQAARLISADFVTSNGIIHTIDRLLVPSTLEPRPDHQKVGRADSSPLTLASDLSDHNLIGNTALKVIQEPLAY